ncbi:MAG TPA: hypothetical protein VH475_19310 [Tepidisphaeraceae bacterium]|jgi:hypothetical protein
MSKRAFTGASLIAGFLFLVCATNAPASVVPVNGISADGRTYPELAAAWYQWALSIPAAVNPMTDRDGSYAVTGQGAQNPVFFLAPSIGGDFTRSIEVGPRTQLFFPVVAAVAFDDPDETFTQAQLRAQLDELLGTTSILYARLDGQQIPNVFAYRAASPAGSSFTIQLPDANLYDLPPGPYDSAVADGWWLLLDPLSPGEHQLRFEGGTGDPNNSELYQGVSYLISVTPEPASVALIGFVALATLASRSRVRRA